MITVMWRVMCSKREMEGELICEDKKGVGEQVQEMHQKNFCHRDIVQDRDP